MLHTAWMDGAMLWLRAMIELPAPAQWLQLLGCILVRLKSLLCRRLLLRPALRCQTQEQVVATAAAELAVLLPVALDLRATSTMLVLPVPVQCLGLLGLASTMQGCHASLHLHGFMSA